MLDKFFAELVNDDDPEKPGEEKAEPGNQRSYCPIKRTGTVVDFANPDAEVKGPRNSNREDGKVSKSFRHEQEYERLSRDEREKQDCPMDLRRRWILRAVARYPHKRGLTHMTSYPEVAIPKRDQ
jgi:hypothetical protein